MERLSYTALGDAINITSRLESLNKIYGTKILVSEVFYQQVKTYFVLRKVDSVLVKGKEAHFNIYELLAEHPSELSFDVVAYKAEFKHAFSLYQHQKWDKSIQHFEKCQQIYPLDTLAPVFIKRIKHLRQEELSPDWNGIWRFEEK